MTSSSSARERAVGLLRSAIQAAAREAFGAVVVERRVPGLSSVFWDVEPLVGIRAAVLARQVAQRRLREYALGARAEGHSWDAIAAALGLEAVEESVSRGERAYLHLVEDRPLFTEDSEVSYGRSVAVARWRCGVCGQSVRDRGPFEAAPFNNEDGHAQDCARHAEEIAAYHVEWGDQA